MKPVASIIIPAFNAEKYISETLASILEQDLSAIEVIVINDGSTDETESIVAGYADPRIRMISIANSGGPSVPRNVGLTESRAEFVFIFDADDIMLPGKLRRSVEALDHAPNAGILFTNFQAVDETGHLTDDNFLSKYQTLYNLPSSTLGPHTNLIKGPDLMLGLSGANFVGTSSVLLRRSTIQSVGHFDARLKNGDDYDYWVRTVAEFDGVFLDLKLHQYRRHTASISRSAPIRRLSSLLVLQESHAKDPKLPEFFRLNSARKCYEGACRLAAEALKAGLVAESRRASRLASRTRPRAVRPYVLLLLSVLPAAVITFLVEVRRRHQ